MIGLQYGMKVALPSFYVSEQDKSQRIHIPIIENLYLDLYESGGYVIDIKRDGYTDTSFELSVVNAGQYSANSVPMKEVVTRPVPVFCQGDQVQVIIKGDDPVPSALTSYSWQGHYNKRAIATIR